jgi:hypothetical protein
MAAEVEKEKEEKEVIRSVKLTLDDEVKSPSEVDNKVLNSL